MLTIEVKRHTQGTNYFGPWIEDHDNGCTFHFHRDDISNEGADILAELFTQQARARRWHPRPTGAPPGPRIPVTMERLPVMEERDMVAVDDRPRYIAYTVRADLISERGAMLITRALASRSPHWMRVPARQLQRQTA